MFSNADTFFIAMNSQSFLVETQMYISLAFITHWVLFTKSPGATLYAYSSPEDASHL